MALDAPKAIYTQLWTLLEASPAFAAAFPAGNRIKRTVTDGGQFPERVKTAPGDFPQIRMDMPGGSQGVNAPKYFHGVADTKPDHAVPMRLQYRVTIIHDSLDETLALPKEAAVMNPLLNAAPRIGLAYVGGCELSQWLRRAQKHGDTLRLESTATITVSAAPNRSQLTD